MRKADFAELVLSLVTSRERAAAIVGDLLEGDDACNPWQFWFFVVRTASCQAWRQMAAAPFGMAGTAILSMSVEFGLLVLWGALIVSVMLLAGDISRANLHTGPPGWSTRSLSFWLSHLVVPFTLGRWISRRYPGRQGAATLSLATLHAAINLSAGLISWAVARVGGVTHLDLIIFIPVIYWDGNILRSLVSSASYLTLYPILLLAGAASVRAKARVISTNAPSWNH